MASVLQRTGNNWCCKLTNNWIFCVLSCVSLCDLGIVVVFLFVPLLSVSSPYPGLTVPALPGTLASLAFPPAARLGFPAIPAGHSVLLVSNLNPEVSGRVTTKPALTTSSMFPHTFVASFMDTWKIIVIQVFRRMRTTLEALLTHRYCKPLWLSSNNETN